MCVYIYIYTHISRSSVCVLGARLVFVQDPAVMRACFALAFALATLDSTFSTLPVSVEKHSSGEESAWENEPSERHNQGETSFCCWIAG